ncbi:MAG: phosphatidate cytidylyltransferase [Gemmatimonadota bacterium]|nr:phosphatidate cytidylyltransferase [Gemmatimonadota bacterium]
MASNLTQRLAVAAVGIPVCVAVTWAGGAVFAAGLAVLAWAGVGELARMAHGRGDAFPARGAALLAAAFPLAVWWAGAGAAWPLAAGSLGLLAGLCVLRVPLAGRPIAGAALGFLGVAYVGGLLSFGVPLREDVLADRTAGTLVFFLPVVVTWITDSAAYFGGRRFGRRQLAPAISPNKTVAGAVAGFVAGPLAAAAYGVLLLPGLGLGPVALAALGGLLAAGATLGDLVESALKREFGVKDSSALLPGHGGLLDRLDSLLWTIPLAWAFLELAR